VSYLVLTVEFALRVALLAVEVIEVVVVQDRLTPVVGQVLMIMGFGVRSHGESWGPYPVSLLFARSPGKVRRQRDPADGTLSLASVTATRRLAVPGWANGSFRQSRSSSQAQSSLA
jgi:hypothetical protein